jgi:sugar lactone lactonase YvrE
MIKYLFSILLLAGITSTYAQTVSTYAGTGIQGSADGSTATATLHSPQGLAIDAAGNVYFTDQLNNKIRKITPGGIVITLAGTGARGSADGPGATASFSAPAGLAVDAAGNVYVADADNDKIRKITPSGVVSTLAGTGEWEDYFTTGTDGPGNIATFSTPTDIAIDAAGNLYVADSGNRKIRKVTPSGVVSTLAGSGGYALTDGTGTKAVFHEPEGITIDAAGNLYVTETFYHKIRKITPAGVVTTIAGSGTSGNADGSATSAYFYLPYDVVADASGNIYVADYNNNAIRKIAPDGTVSTLAGTGTAGNADGFAGTATFNHPARLAIDASGNLYVTEWPNYKIRKIAMTKNQTITGLSNMVKNTTDDVFTLSATASSALPVSYSSSNTSVAIVTGNVVTITGPGTAAITASQAGNTTWSPMTQTVTLTVLKAGQSITGLNDIYKNSADAPFTLPSAASSGLSVTYSSSNVSVATISGNTVTITGVGTTTITANQYGNKMYDAATPVSVTMTVTKASANQMIPGFTDMYRFFGDPAVTLSEKSSSGETISYSSSNTSVAVTSSNAVHIFGVGTATITASLFASGQTYTATITVAKAPQTIAGLTSMTKIATDNNFLLPAGTDKGYSLTYTSSNPAVATITGNTVKLTGSGTTTITAYHAGTNIYTPVSQSVTLTVIKASQTIASIADNTTEANATSYYLYPTASSGLPVTLSSSNTAVATISGNKVTIVGAGESTITATQAGNEKYTAVSTSSLLKVNKARQYLYAIADVNKAPSDPVFTLTEYSSASLKVTYTSSNPAVATISGNTVTIKGMGTTVITGSQAGDAKYEAATNITTTLTVGKKSQSIIYLTDMTAVASEGYLYLNSARATSELPLTYTSSNLSVATISGNTVTIVGAGTTIITASQAGNENYAAATPVSATLIISKGNQEISGLKDMQNSVSDVFYFINDAYATSGLPLSFTSSDIAVATVSGNKVTFTGGGTTTITASQAGNAKYNAATPVSAKLTVSKANQTISNLFDMQSVLSDGSLTLSGTASSGLPVSYTSSDPKVATISGNKVTFVGAGVTTITATQAGDGKYNAATSVSVSLTVTTAIKTSQYIFGLSDMAKLTTDQPFYLKKVATSGLPITYTSSNPSVAKISGNIVTIAGPGSTILTASQPGNDQYSEATPVSATLTVTGPSISKLEQIITGMEDLIVKTTDDPAFTLNATATSGLTVSYTSSNLAVATISGNKVTLVGEGTTTITASQSGNASYNAATPVKVMLSVRSGVEKSTQTIYGLSSIIKFAADAPFNLSATSTSGLAVSYTSSDLSVAIVSGNKVTIVGAGTTTITATQAGNAFYYQAEPVAVTLYVYKTSQSITGLSNLIKFKNDSPFTLSGVASSGLPVTYTSSDPKVATISGNKVTIVDYGSIQITATQAGNDKYNAANTITFWLDVIKQPQTIPGLSDMEKNISEGSFTLPATTSSGLPVTYGSSNSSVATIEGNKVTIRGTGTVTIYVSQSGNEIYDNLYYSVKLTVTLVTALEGNTISVELYKAYDNGNSTILIEADEIDVINVTDLSGRSVYIGNARQIEVPQTGLYFVTMVNKNTRIVNKVFVK